jgi:hypothetical protein
VHDGEHDLVVVLVRVEAVEELREQTAGSREQRRAAAVLGERADEADGLERRVVLDHPGDEQLVDELERAGVRELLGQLVHAAER